MPNPLSDARIKLGRAKRHFAEFQAEVKAFMESNPWDVAIEEDPATRHHVFKFVQKHAIPEDWGSIIGDIIHNLRSALDHLATQIILASGIKGRDRLKKAYFPIGATREAFEDRCGKYLRGADAAAVKIVKRLRPYREGRTALWLLHQLDILDKHTNLIPTGIGMLGAQDEIGSGDVPIAQRIYPIRDGAAFGSVNPFDSTGMFRSDKYKTTFQFAIAFGEGQILDGEPVAETLTEFIDLVERTLDIFDTWYFQRASSKV